ncbi:hypothetical protein GF345_01695 [Candidatus Woesearchaeota archaeon]|nr:hypothetical protein [Candidatus Woesearchaeota archaeon]
MDKKEKELKDLDNEVSEYKGLDTRYVVYILFAVGVTAGLLFLVQTIDKSINPVSATGSVVYSPDILDQYIENPNELKSLFGKTSGEIPGWLRSMFGNERVNATVIRMDGSKVNMAVTTKKGMLSDVSIGEMQDPTMQVQMSEDTIKRIYESENPVDDIEDALETEEIKYDTQRLTSAVKMGILNTAINVMSWFT